MELIVTLMITGGGFQEVLFVRIIFRTAVIRLDCFLIHYYEFYSHLQVTVTDIWGQNVLHAVTWTDHVHTAELLLGLGCDYRKEDKWRIIPGLLAVKICSSSILECLLKHDKKFHLGKYLYKYITTNNNFMSLLRSQIH